MRLQSCLIALAIITIGPQPANANWGIPLWCDVERVVENGQERPGNVTEGFSVPLMEGTVYVKEDACMYYRLEGISANEFVLTCDGSARTRAVLRLDRHSTAFHKVMTFTGSKGESEIVTFGNCHITLPPICCPLTPEEEERARERVERELRRLDHGVIPDEESERRSRIVR